VPFGIDELAWKWLVRKQRLGKEKSGLCSALRRFRFVVRRTGIG
jgi:hypothetical protein